jgi:hypothetical protein
MSIFVLCTFLLSTKIHRNILDKVEHPGIGATEMVLSNGMRVCYKCTDFLDDQVSSILELIPLATSRPFYHNFVDGSP